jgi:hypothetical protein
VFEGIIRTLQRRYSKLHTKVQSAFDTGTAVFQKKNYRSSYVFRKISIFFFTLLFDVSSVNQSLKQLIVYSGTAIKFKDFLSSVFYIFSPIFVNRFEFFMRPLCNPVMYRTLYVSPDVRAETPLVM